MSAVISRLLSSPDNCARVLIGGLFLALAWRLGHDFVDTRRVTDLLLLVGESLVVIFTYLRRPASVVDRRAAARLVTAVSMMSPLLVRPAQNAALIGESAAAALIGVGLVIVVAAKLSLGCSLGLLPANRGVMDRGMYRIVRHPMYLGYLLAHIPFLAAHPSGWNLAVLLVGDAALVVRAFYEEQTLARDPKYAQYRETVRWRLIPGLC